MHNARLFPTLPQQCTKKQHPLTYASSAAPQRWLWQPTSPQPQPTAFTPPSTKSNILLLPEITNIYFSNIQPVQRRQGPVLSGEACAFDNLSGGGIDFSRIFSYPESLNGAVSRLMGRLLTMIPCYAHPKALFPACFSRLSLAVCRRRPARCADCHSGIYRKPGRTVAPRRRGLQLPHSTHSLQPLLRVPRSRHQQPGGRAAA